MKSILARFIGAGPVINLNRDECIFCRIVDGHQREKVLYEDETIVIFPDIRPAGIAHLQIVPKKHIINVHALQPGQQDYELVESMLHAGTEILQKLHPDAKQYKFGFHLEPFHSVLHLHMHAFVLPHKPFQSWFGLKYSAWKPWWLPAEELLEQLRPK